ncbi:MAG: hypothetical protein E7111_06310 [Bacteroidales bacterium]|nr:hypothetical protein [Bacteroidales bacterium]
MKRIIIMSMAALVCLCSCSTYQYSTRQVAINNQNITAAPTVVDVKVDYTKRISETSRKCKSQAEAMQEAKYNAIVKNNIDVLVDMIYKVENVGRKYIVTITGFAGYYVNSRTFYEDIKLLEGVKKEDVEKYLILHNPEVIKYMNQKGEVVNIYHNEK